jgi:predicted deacylase
MIALLLAGAIAVSSPLQRGRSQYGRPIVAVRVGDPRGTRVLVVGCIHGSESAGIAVARALEHVTTHLDLWIVPNLNPDGFARGTRQNGRGVDLNANWSSQWRGGGRPWTSGVRGRFEGRDVDDDAHATALLMRFLEGLWIDFAWPRRTRSIRLLPIYCPATTTGSASSCATSGAFATAAGSLHARGGVARLVDLCASSS